MNIKNRLKRLERETNGNSEHCACSEPKTVWRDERVRYDAYSTGEYVAYQGSEQFKADEERDLQPPDWSDLCPDCNKPIGQRVIILQLIEPPLGQDNFHDTENRIKEWAW